MGQAIGGARNSRAQLGGDHIFAADIESAVADFMALTRATNLQLGTSEYDVQVGIEWGGGTPLVVRTVDPMNYPIPNANVSVDHLLAEIDISSRPRRRLLLSRHKRAVRQLESEMPCRNGFRDRGVNSIKI
ncbi:hypothetical protein [Rhodococcus sp. APC 3903]|uniref:hypothetical protein n=1 Tax=Rhodococcus sp. APC 3903 TaxID=3035193 RepID=UPI0025B4FE17|nr:hypothetical protein [Rhodococcus sp. APC 3903]MDN3459872.1 hypothetical protein [Rhodococcus sp. APC 3903]